jgi:hypothetical protein
MTNVFSLDDINDEFSNIFCMVTNSLKSFGNALLPWRVVRRALRRRVVRHCELVSAAIASGRAALERPIQRLRRRPPTRMPPPTTAADAHGRNASPQRSPRSATLGNKRM